MKSGKERHVRLYYIFCFKMNHKMLPPIFLFPCFCVFDVMLFYIYDSILCHCQEIHFWVYIFILVYLFTLHCCRCFGLHFLNKFLPVLFLEKSDSRWLFTFFEKSDSCMFTCWHMTAICCLQFETPEMPAIFLVSCCWCDVTWLLYYVVNKYISESTFIFVG